MMKTTAPTARSKEFASEGSKVIRLSGSSGLSSSFFFATFLFVVEKKVDIAIIFFGRSNAEAGCPEYSELELPPVPTFLLSLRDTKLSPLLLIFKAENKFLLNFKYRGLI